MPQLLMILIFAAIGLGAAVRHGKKSSDGSTVNAIPATGLVVVQALLLWWGGFW